MASSTSSSTVGIRSHRELSAVSLEEHKQGVETVEDNEKENIGFEKISSRMLH